MDGISAFLGLLQISKALKKTLRGGPFEVQTLQITSYFLSLISIQITTIDAKKGQPNGYPLNSLSTTYN